jgi:prepilin-type N-terminal cleavage/methylation domain-containing protein
MKNMLFRHPKKKRKNAVNKRGFSAQFDKKHGITIIELLIVLTILAILFLVVFFYFQTQLSKSRDARRKSDLDSIKIAFEEYHNDNNCYPDPELLQVCYSDSFSPYLSQVPCDPLSNTPYIYVPLQENRCAGYRVYTSLEYQDDPIIASLGCNTPQGCGLGAAYNYGISSGVPVVADPSELVMPNASPGTSPTPTPVIIYKYACDTAGTCNSYEESNPYLLTCPVTFEQSNCNNQCNNVANRCSG